MHSKNTQGTSLNSLPVSQHESKKQNMRQVGHCTKQECAQVCFCSLSRHILWTGQWNTSTSESDLSDPLTSSTDTQCCWCNKRLPSQATDAFKNDFSNLLSSQSTHTRTSFLWLKHWMHSTPSTSFFPQYLSCKIHLRFGMCKLCIHLFHLCYAKLTGYLCPLLMWHRSTRK